MWMTNINGRKVSVDVRQSSHPMRESSKSSLQSLVGSILTEKYPYDTILEEFFIPGSRLSFDFFLPRKMLVIECDGRQHDEYIGFFHGDRVSGGFGKQVSRDMLKEKWAQENKIRLVRIKQKCKTTKEEILGLLE